jgi:hypothetical protein
MPESKPKAAVQIVLSIANDVMTAGGAAALGAALGHLIYLGVAGLVQGLLPQKSDVFLLPWSVIFGLNGGAVVGLILRGAIGKIQRRWRWAIGFFVFGSVAGPLVLIALVAYALSGLQSIIIG